MNNGTYKGKIKDYGYTKSPKTGTVSVMVQFDIYEGDDLFQLVWNGYLSEKAKEKTIKTLVEVLGFKGTNGEEIANGIGSGVLNEDQEYDLVIENEEYKGKFYPKIKWINLQGQSGGKIGKLSKAEVIQSGINITGDLLAMKQSMPKKAPDDDIEF